MSAYKLKDDGYPTFKKIIHGRKWVGRVGRKVDGTFIGIIGRTEFTGPDEGTVFAEVVARHLGYESAAALHARNSRVRSENREARRQARSLASRFLDGTFADQLSVLDELIEKEEASLKTTH